MDESKIFERYYNLALRFLSYRPRSKKEIVDYLNKKSAKSSSLTEEIIAGILAKLFEYNFIDDRKFSQFWIEQRTKFKHKPIWVIKLELRQKGIDHELIEEALEALDNTKDTDLTSAKKLAEKKLDFYRGLDRVKRREKVISFLLRKGFSYDLVKKVFLDSPPAGGSLEE